MGSKTNAAAAVAILAVGSLGYLWTTRLSNTEALCEGYILEHVRSPTTYKRIDIDSSSHVISSPREFYLARQNQFPSKSELELAKEGLLKLGGTPAMHIVRVEYDAANVFGTLVRSRSVCAFFDPNKMGEPRMSLLNLNSVTEDR